MGLGETTHARVSVTRILGFLLASAVLAALLLPLHARGEAATGEQFTATLPGPATDVDISDGGKMVVSSAAGSMHFYADRSGNGEAYAAPNAGPLSDVRASFDFAGVTASAQWSFGAANWASWRDGSLFAFRDGTNPAWSYEIADSGDAFKPSRITGMSVSAGVPYVAVGTDHGEVYLFRADSGQSPMLPTDVFRYGANNQPLGNVRGVSLAQDGQYVLVGTASTGLPSLHLYDRTFLLRSFPEVAEPVTAVALSPDGSVGAAGVKGADSSRLVVIATEDRKVLWDWLAPAEVRALAISDHGGLIAAGLADGTLALFTKQYRVDQWRVPVTHGLGSTVRDCEASRDSRHVACTTAAGTIQFLSPAAPEVLWSYAASGDAGAVAMASQAGFVAMATRPADGAAGKAIEFVELRDASLRGQSNLEAAPGEVIASSLEVVNEGNRVETVRLSACCAAEGWSLSVPNKAYDVAPGKPVTIGYQVAPPGGASPGSRSFTITADFVSGAARTLDITVHVLERHGVGLDLGATLLEARPGETAVLNLRIVNVGNGDETVSLSAASLPPGILATFQPAGPLMLGALESAGVTLSLAVPSPMDAGDHPIDIRATAPGNVATETIILRVLEADAAKLPLGDGEGPAAPQTGALETESGEEAPAKRSKKGRLPGFEGATLVAVGLGALLLARRKRSP